MLFSFSSSLYVFIRSASSRLSCDVLEVTQLIVGRLEIKWKGRATALELCFGWFDLSF